MIPFWPRFHAFRGSGRRDYEPQPLRRLSASDCTGCDSHTSNSGVRDFLELRAYSQGKYLGTSEPWTPFWLRCHAFRGSGRREFRGHPLCLTLTHATPECVISRRCAPIPKGTPLGLVNLELHFGPVPMRSVEVVGLSSRHTPCV